MKVTVCRLMRRLVFCDEKLWPVVLMSSKEAIGVNCATTVGCLRFDISKDIGERSPAHTGELGEHLGDTSVVEHTADTSCHKPFRRAELENLR